MGELVLVLFIASLGVLIVLGFLANDRKTWRHHCTELHNAPVDVPDGLDCPWCGNHEHHEHCA